MVLFGSKMKKSKKDAQNKTNAASTASKPNPRRLESIERLLHSVKIGTRIRYHQEYEEHTVLENLVIGYRINDIFIFRQSDISFEKDDMRSVIVLQTPEGRKEFTGEGDIQLVLPASMGEEKKLDIESRANLAKLRPLRPESRLVVLSTSYNAGHLKVDAEVYCHIKLNEGVHTGLQVVLLEVLLDTMETLEQRQCTRVNSNLPVTVSKNGKESIMHGRLLDFSEKSMRLALEKETDEWPIFGKKDFALVGLKPAPDKPLIKLRCECMGQRGAERIFEMTHIVRQGGSKPFEMLDALEIKVDLINSNSTS